MSVSGSESSSGPSYRGRFAPSPTGPLHFGSLITALASFLRARSQQGVWLVRMEDLDPPREMPGAADEILRTLEALELHWDETVRYQSSRHEAYEAALAQLREQGLAYACGCTRSEIAAAQHGDQPGEEPVYPGTCRSGLAPGREPRAWRVLTHGEPIHFDDLLQGPQRHVLEQICGDFVVRRADQFFAYQLAVVWTTLISASPKWSGGATCSTPPPARSICNGCSTWPHPVTCTCPWSWTRPGSN